jgi:hypothetical protein
VSRGRPIVRRVAAASASLFSLALLVTGCTSSGGTAPTQTGSPTGYVSKAESDAYGERMVACLADAGWEATLEPDGGVSLEGPEEQAGAIDAALEACTEQLGYDRPPAPMSQEEAESYLDGLEITAQCLRDNGYSVPPQPPRSESIEGLMSTTLDPGWDPFGDVTTGLPDAMTTCPYND